MGADVLHGNVARHHEVPGLTVTAPVASEMMRSSGQTRRRVHRSAVVLLVTTLAIGMIACDAALPRQIADPRLTGPAPAVEATLRASLHATAVAVSQPVEPAPTIGSAAWEVRVPTPTVRPTTIPMPKSEATPGPASTAPPGTSVEPFGFTAYRLQSGWTFVQGFVENRGTATAGNIQVLVSLIADGDVLAGTAQAHIGPGLLKPGDRSPWLAQFQKPPDFLRVRVEAHAHPLTDLSQATVTRDFQFEDVNVRHPADHVSTATIVGELTNVGARPATDIRVVAAIYDEEGSLFQVVRGQVHQMEIADGERTTFEIRPLGRGLKEIPRYELFAEGRPIP